MGAWLLQRGGEMRERRKGTQPAGRGRAEQTERPPGRSNGGHGDTWRSSSTQKQSSRALVLVVAAKPSGRVSFPLPAAPQFLSSHGGGSGSGGSPSLLCADRLTRNSSFQRSRQPSRPLGQTSEMLLLPHVAQPRRLAARARGPQSQAGPDRCHQGGSRTCGTIPASSSAPQPPPPPRPPAVVKFVGGAFIGAVPETTYGYLRELLAREGFLVVCVPYNVTFDHEAAAREAFERFHACYNALLPSGLPEAGLSALKIAELQLYSVGHSNGALL